MAPTTNRNLAKPCKQSTSPNWLRFVLHRSRHPRAIDLMAKRSPNDRRLTSSMQHLVLLLLIAVPLIAADWPRFRGPNGTGVADARNLPSEIGPGKNVAWKTALPA